MAADEELQLRRLREAVGAIAGLREQNVYSTEFTTWERRTAQALEELLGAEHKYSMTFNSLQFWLARLVEEPGEWTEWDQAKYEGDLSEAEDIIRDALEELEIGKRDATADRPAGSRGTVGLPLSHSSRSGSRAEPTRRGNCPRPGSGSQ